MLVKGVSQVKTITVRIPEELYHRLKVEVAKQQTTLKDYVEEAIKDKMKESQN